MQIKRKPKLASAHAQHQRRAQANTKTHRLNTSNTACATTRTQSAHQADAHTHAATHNTTEQTRVNVSAHPKQDPRRATTIATTTRPTCNAQRAHRFNTDFIKSSSDNTNKGRDHNHEEQHADTRRGAPSHTTAALINHAAREDTSQQ